MNTKAIIFDKDGTLMDFDSFWVTVSVNAAENVLGQLGITDVPTDEVLTAFGVHNGVTDIEGALCKGTYEQLGHILNGVLNNYGHVIDDNKIVDMLIDAYNTHADSGVVTPTCPDLAEVLTELKKRNVRLAVVTTDNETITRKCLDKLGIAHLFDKIYTDDGVLPTKPNPYCAKDFARFAKLPQERLVMVGDTMTDMTFAKNAGIAAIGIAKTEKNQATLAPHAKTVISSIRDLLNVLA